MSFLKKLIRAHRSHIPIENLRAYYGPELPYDKKVLFEQIIPGKRGGYQLQLNALFADLLSALGFATDIISAARWLDNEQWGPDYELMFIRVKIGEREYLVDVGLPGGPASPLVINNEQVQLEGVSYYTILYSPDRELILKRSGDGLSFVTIGRSDGTSKKFIQFLDRDTKFRKEKKFPFLDEKICLLESASQKTILTGQELTMVKNGERYIYPVYFEEDFLSKLEQHFEINPVEN